MKCEAPQWPQPAGLSLVILSSRGTAGPQEHRPVTERDLNFQSSRLRSRPPRALAQIYYDCLFPLDWTTSFFSDAFIVPRTCQLVNKARSQVPPAHGDACKMEGMS